MAGPTEATVTGNAVIALSAFGGLIAQKILKTPNIPNTYQAVTICGANMMRFIKI